MVNIVPDTWGSNAPLQWARDMASDTNADYIFFCETDYPNDFPLQQSDVFSFLAGEFEDVDGVLVVHDAVKVQYINGFIQSTSYNEDVSFTFNGRLCYTSIQNDNYPALVDRYDSIQEGVLLYALLISTIIIFLYRAIYDLLRQARRISD